MRRAGYSLIELLVVLFLLASFVGLFLPAAQRWRGVSRRAACANNLRQIGVGAIGYRDAMRKWVAARECPAPWRRGSDPACEGVPSASAYTGPAERWWAPYDNRPGATPTRALPGFAGAGILSPFVGESRAVFQCPDGTDRTTGSPGVGGRFQVGYAMGFSFGPKPRLGDWSGFVWEHDGAPACMSGATHDESWLADAARLRARHFPDRHLGGHNVLHGDGCVDFQRAGE